MAIPSLCRKSFLLGPHWTAKGRTGLFPRPLLATPGVAELVQFSLKGHGSQPSGKDWHLCELSAMQFSKWPKHIQSSVFHSESNQYRHDTGFNSQRAAWSLPLPGLSPKNIQCSRCLPFLILSKDEVSCNTTDEYVRVCDIFPWSWDRTSQNSCSSTTWCESHYVRHRTSFTILSSGSQWIPVVRKTQRHAKTSKGSKTSKCTNLQGQIGQKPCFRRQSCDGIFTFLCLRICGFDGLTRTCRRNL